MSVSVSRAISPHPTRSLSILTVFLLFWLICVYWPPPHPSEAALMAISLFETFPGTPSTEVNITWPSSKNAREQSHSFSNIHSTYPKPSTVGPRPKRQWIKRLNWLKKHAAALKDKSLAISLALPPAILQADGYVVYPDGTNLGAGEGGICSWERTGCLKNQQNGYTKHLDIIDSDHGTWAVNFDDGPLPPSKSLYQVLDRFDVKATHFWIGGNVLKHWDLALLASKRGYHLAVHTWSHSHLTSLSDLEILGELGWCIEIISHLTGKVPRYFRPPYGNIDNRVRAIAKHVFGLNTVIWNYDSMDWGLNQTYATGDQVDKPDPATAPSLEKVTQDIISHAQSIATQMAGCMILEHELSEESIQAFSRSYESVKSAGWKTGPLPECIYEGNAPWYQ